MTSDRQVFTLYAVVCALSLGAFLGWAVMEVPHAC